jgi:hypothetical protein
MLTRAIRPSTWSRQSIRVRFTPCHSGVSRATDSSAVPRLLIGKKDPEKRKSGTRPSRKIRPNEASLRTYALKAKVHTANAIPTNIVTSQATTGPHQDSKTPNGAITRK